MKTLSTLLFFVATTSSLFAEGWRDLIASDKKDPLVSAPKIEARVGKHEMLVRVTNVSTETLCYSGYASESPQVFLEKLENGKWIEAGWDWCGTGMRSYTIPPNKTVEFKFAERGLGSARRIFTVFSTERSKRQSVVLLCEMK